MPDALAQPDVRQLNGEELPRSQFPAEGPQDFRVYFAPACHAEILRHAREDVSVEICGVLVGLWRRDDDGPFVEISDSIRADKAASKFAEVTFTHDSWAKINQVMDERFSNLRIVGWYHSHPDFGIFLSDRDVFIQQNFFSSPGQVAHVVDPVRQTEGVFVWRDGKPAPSAHYWVGREVHAEPAGKPSKESTGHMHARGVTAAQTASAVESLRDAPLPWLNWTTMLLLFVLGCLVWQLLGQQRSNWERQMLFEGVVKHYGMWKTLRPGLKRELDTIDANLALVTAATAALAEEHIQLAGEGGAQKKKQWKDTLTALAATRQQLETVEQVYSLTEEEASFVERMLTAAANPPGPPAPGDQTENKTDKKADDKSGDQKSQKSPAKPE